MAFRRTKKLISFLAAFFFLISNLSWAAPAPNVTLYSNQLEQKNNPGIQIPSELGLIKEAFYPTGTSKSPFVIHIQTAHANYETALRLCETISDPFGKSRLW